jgi:endonuclease/exonuclease/phosphatase family metal-dependent hydrolase
VTAAKVENFDVEMPRPNGDDVRLTDFDVIIVRNGVTYTAASTGSFTTILSVPVATGQFIDIKRGWAAIDLTVDGVTFRVANTHLESASTPIRLAQGLELLDELDGETRPTIVLGDLNSPVDGSDPTYPEYLDAGFVDAWPLASATAGLTCCQNYDLKNSSSVLDKRIDLVLFRHSKEPFSVNADVVGDDPSDRTASGLWPSDHAGVWARINFRR